MPVISYQQRWSAIAKQGRKTHVVLADLHEATHRIEARERDISVGELMSLILRSLAVTTTVIAIKRLLAPVVTLRYVMPRCLASD